jgi:hypothetical protein
MLKLVHLVLYLLQVSEGRECGFMNGRTRLEVYVLREQAETHAARTHNVAFVRHFLAADETKDGRLPRPVAPYQSGMLALVDLQRCAAQDILRAIGFVNV